MRPTSKQKIGPKPFFLQFFPDYITNPHFLGEGKENCGGFFTGIRVFLEAKNTTSATSQASSTGVVDVSHILRFKQASLIAGILKNPQNLKFGSKSIMQAAKPSQKNGRPS